MRVTEPRLCLSCGEIRTEFATERLAHDGVGPYCQACIHGSDNAPKPPHDTVRACTKRHWTSIKTRSTKVNSRQKGKRGELEAAKAWEAATGLSVHRTAQTDCKLSADLAGVDGIHLEVKRRQRIASLDYLVQAETDAADRSGSTDVPVVLMREDNDTRWALMIPLDRISDLVSVLSGTT